MTDQQPSRRAFLRGAAALGGSLVSLPAAVRADEPPPREAGSAGAEILRQPDAIVAYAALNAPTPLTRQGDAWTSGGVHVAFEPDSSGKELAIRLTSPASPVSHLHLRWSVRSPADLRCLGDAWERSYGDLEWRGIVPDRVMPWYFLTFDGHTLHGYGVKTQPSAFCFWQLDQEGISLWTDVRNGGMPLQLGQRQLDVATVVAHSGVPGETPFAAAKAFCRTMCTAPRLPSGPLFGSNDWYYAYGQNTADGILRNADLVAQVALSSGPRPFVVIDDGWQDPKRFPSLPDLAASIRSQKLRPGIWIRPLQAPSGANPSLLLPDARFGSQHASPAWDPTIPEAMEKILDTVRQPLSWGYELIKHDYSTFELLGRWGSSMGPLPTNGGWQFSDRSLTTAEIILRFYKSLREAAGENVILLGCNTIGHLSAGIFESQRIGDDVSGTNWERTRRMGVNTLGLRLPQHSTFFCVDPDCIPLTKDIDWRDTRQWLDVVARTGVALFVSPKPGAAGPEQIAALRDAFHLVGHSHGYAEDWLTTTSPQRWQFGDNRPTLYDWSGPDGSFPFPV